MRFAALCLLASVSARVLAHGSPGEDGAGESGKEWVQDDREELERKWGFDVRFSLLC
jgi:hypothetical protein